MMPDKWQETRDKIQSVFGDAELSKETDEDGGTAEILEFTGPSGRMRLEYSTRPLVLDKQVIGARRIGAHHEVKYILSDTEVTHSLKAFKWDGDSDNWIEIDLKGSFAI